MKGRGTAPAPFYRYYTMKRKNAGIIAALGWGNFVLFNQDWLAALIAAALTLTAIVCAKGGK